MLKINNIIKELDLKDFNCQVFVDKNLSNQAIELINKLGNYKNKVFISDKKIFDNCKIFFEENFLENFSNVILLENPKADDTTISKISEKLGKCDLIVALGSGTINDLCKYISFNSVADYIIFASAPSMNGYLSKTSSLILNGHKKTISTKVANAVFCDLNILKSSPAEMVKAGIGDSLCFYSCWFDWLLSHLLIETDFNSKCFEIVNERIAFLIENYKNFNIKDEALLKLLIEILLLSGIAMSLSKGSYPASQSEHLIAHVFEMKYPHKAQEILHGLQIATATLTSLEIQEELINQDSVFLRDYSYPEQKISNFFSPIIASECKSEYLIKYNIIKSGHKFIKNELENNWQSYVGVLSRIVMSKELLKEIFWHFKIDFGYKYLGLTYQEYQELVSFAKFIRRRYTCLDL